MDIVRRRRVALMTLALLAAACATQAARIGAPSPSPSAEPSVTATASPTPRPTNATNDVLYVRRQLPQTSDQGINVIEVIAARTGAAIRQMPAGAVTPGGKLLVRTTSADGGTRTIVHVVDVATGTDVRSVPLDGDLRLVQTGAPWPDRAVSPDGRLVVLQQPPVQLDGKWVTRFAVADTVAGTARSTEELRATTSYQYLANSADGRTLYLAEYGGGAVRTRVYDLARGALRADPVDTWDPQANGFATPFVSGTGGTPLFSLRTTSEEAYVLAADPGSGRVARTALPKEQAHGGIEEILLWSLLVTPDGTTLYAVNPAFGVVDEIDVKALAVRRTGTFEVTRDATGDALARLRRILFPAAEAKEILRPGAVISPDGKTLFAIGRGGIVAIDTASLSARLVWREENSSRFGSLALSPDGARLYAVDDGRREIVVLDARRGMTRLGALSLSGYVDSIVRIDAP